MQRIEMHLESLGAPRVTIPRAGVTISFEIGERIWTESSYKYEPGQIEDLGIDAGFTVAEQWIDADARFALTLFAL
jgi:L-histidine Nalpha-methyltransferase